MKMLVLRADNKAPTHELMINTESVETMYFEGCKIYVSTKNGLTHNIEYTTHGDAQTAFKQALDRLKV